MEIVSIEVFGGRGVAKNEVEDFENEELEGGFGLAVEEEDEVAAEGFVGHSVGG